MLDEQEIRSLVEKYIPGEGGDFLVQELIKHGPIPRLRDYIVKPGKVSDSIFGGKGSFFDKKHGRVVEFENPPLETKDGRPLRLMVRTDRISTHDINRGTIPFKDQVLAINHHHMLRVVERNIGTSQLEIGLGDNSVVIVAENLTALPFENVLRFYLAKTSTKTSLYQHYIHGGRFFSGHHLPDGLIANGLLPYLIDTPTTKSDEHDLPTSQRELIEQGLVKELDYIILKNASAVAFGMAYKHLIQRGIILADTKLEHGINREGKVVSQDELFTMDSSRYWLKDDYDEQVRFLKEEKINELNPRNFSKEFARDFSSGDQPYDYDQRVLIAVRYIQGIQEITGHQFIPDMRSKEERILGGLQKIFDEMVR
ncbi:MAG: phosphoribosylaminoimidazolesuccinocarboxamide synthase [archaeon]|nr:phosphoribosylaminoimidazolesuccinocarboxamide synthase [archaeon]